MKRKLLAVMPQSLNYGSFYDVDVAYSFQEAKEMIELAETNGNPYEDLDLPAGDEKTFWEFINWMEITRRRYRFSIFGVKTEKQFWEIAEKARNKGFHFNT